MHPLQIRYRYAKRIVVALVGGTVLLAGIAMIVLPGPAVVVIPIGLGILGLEFAWARAWLAGSASPSVSSIAATAFMSSSSFRK